MSQSQALKRKEEITDADGEVRYNFHKTLEEYKRYSLPIETKQQKIERLEKEIEQAEADILYAKELEQKYHQIIYTQSRHEEFWTAVCKVCFLDPLTVRQEKTIKTNSFILRTLQHPRSKSTGGISDIDIARAKEFPITDLISFKGKTAICPFHNEDHSSLYYYADKNICHCFGACSKSFDSIDVYMGLNPGVDFISAVKFLAGV